MMLKNLTEAESRINMNIERLLWTETNGSHSGSGPHFNASKRCLTKLHKRRSRMPEKMSRRSLAVRIAREFKPYIVKRSKGGCTVELPLRNLDLLVDRVIAAITGERDPRRNPRLGDRVRDKYGHEIVVHPRLLLEVRDLKTWRRRI